jgi:hypothetical protein
MTSVMTPGTHSTRGNAKEPIFLTGILRVQRRSPFVVRRGSEGILVALLPVSNCLRCLSGSRHAVALISEVKQRNQRLQFL